MLYDHYQTSVSERLARAEQLALPKCGLGRSRLAPLTSLSVASRTIRGIPSSRVKHAYRVLDCDGMSRCEVVGEEEQILGPVIPAGQVRDISESIYFTGSTHVKGSFQWNYTITTARR